jgi:hypothetical protein
MRRGAPATSVIPVSVNGWSPGTPTRSVPADAEAQGDTIHAIALTKTTVLLKDPIII